MMMGRLESEAAAAAAAATENYSKRFLCEHVTSTNIFSTHLLLSVKSLDKLSFDIKHYSVL